MNSFAMRLSIESTAKSTNNLTVFAEACVDVEGGAFEHGMKTARRAFSLFLWKCIHVSKNFMHSTLRKYVENKFISSISFITSL